jgi:hypothetical protein
MMSPCCFRLQKPDKTAFYALKSPIEQVKMSAVIADKPKGSPLQQIAALLEGSEGEAELIVPRAALMAAMKEMAEKADVGVAIQEAAQAIRGAQIHPRLVHLMGETWKVVVAPPHFVPMSQVGLEQLTRQALATSKALMPATITLPSDGVLEIPMMALMLRLLDLCRAR